MCATRSHQQRISATQTGNQTTYFESMPGLNYEHEQFIIKKLACDEEPSAIADAVRERFLIDVRPEEIDRYRPNSAAAGDLPDMLRALFRRTRSEYLAGQERQAVPTFVEVAAVSDFNDRPMLCVEEKDKQIAVVKKGDTYFAMDNTCTHQGGPLCEGTLTDDRVECPWHGSRFDVTSGDVAAPPAADPVATYSVRRRDDAIEVKL